jgi:RND family efflux transporter MFP subunit
MHPIIMRDDQRKSKQTIVIVTAMLIGAALIFFAARHFTHKIAPLPAQKVMVAHPTSQAVVEYVTQTGTLVAYNSVDLVARVAGYLDSIAFTDGAVVKKGQPLFVIQPEPYMEQLKAAEATVVIQQSLSDYNKSEYDRQKRMYKQNATSLNNVEKWLAKTQESEAAIAKAKAEAEIAAINYSYTHINAPFDGRIGRHLVDPGNLVGNGVATNLATIDQIDPIYVYFNLNEIDLIKLREAARKVGFKVGDINRIPAYVKLQTETTFSHKGMLDFVNTGLNASTGTLEFRAILDNPDYVLLPGLFVQVRIPVSQPKETLMVPNYAVLYDQIGPYVLTVDHQNTVQLTRVALGVEEGGNQAILEGITVNDKVIVSGLQFATPGNVVEPHEET